MEFQPFPKIARLNKDVVITEKLDGTNAQIHIEVVCGDLWPDYSAEKLKTVTWAGFNPGTDDVFVVRAGSRKRWIVPGDDNFGFAHWVKENATDLFELGPGQHFGEWWGRGIQRNYSQTERHFSLFNVGRWYDNNTPVEFITDKMDPAPIGCSVVPILGIGPIHTANQAMKDLQKNGSRAAPGFTDPEGVIVFHTGNGALFKRTFEFENGKGNGSA